MNIRTRMLIAFLVVTLFSVGALSIIAFKNSSDSIKKEVEAALNSVVEEKVAHIYAYIQQKEQAIMLSATQPIIAEALSQFTIAFKQGHNSEDYRLKNKKYGAYLQQLKERLNGYELFLISENGDIVFSVRNESSFASNLYNGPYQSSQLAMSFKKSARLLETQVSQFKPFAPSQWQGPIVQGQVERTNNANAYGKETHSAFITAPVFNGDKLLGVLATQLNSNDYYHLASDYTALKQTGEIVFGKQVGNTALIIAPLRSDPDAAFNLQFAMGSDAAPILEKALNGEKGSGLSTDYKGNDILAAWRHIPELQWGIVVKIDTDEAFSSVHRLKMEFAITGFIIALLASMFALYFSHRLTSPILKLVKSTEAMMNGDLSQDIESQSSDEIGRLAKSFNLMLKVRRRHVSQLEDSAFRSQEALDDLANHKFVLDQHAIVAATDIDGTITFANEKFAQISGYSIEELIGQNHRILNSETHEPEFFKEMYDTISKGDVWQGDLCNKAKDGHLYWVYTTIVPVMKGGKPESYIAIRNDISKRKKLEHEYQRVARFALENPSIVLKISQSNKILFANPAGLKILRKLKIFLGDFAPKDWHDAIQTVLVSKSIFRFEETFDDTVILLTLKYISDPKGASVNIYGSDISDLKKVENDLIQAKQSAEQAAIAKSDFLASMSHEIRTPMNGVLGMLGLLLETELSVEQKRKAVIAQSSAESLLSIINNILDFSKVEAGKLTLECLDFNLRDYLGDFAEAMAIQAQDKNLELILDITEVEHSIVKGDPGRLRQIMTNLVSNAIKFTDEGEVIIRAKLKNSNNRQVIFTCCIEDTGIGIPLKKQSLLFDSFSQADASTTRKYGGTGLGLAIVRQLCELMDGEVNIVSEESKGSTFTFSITLYKSDASQIVHACVDITGKGILVIDDNTKTREALRHQLEHWGAIVSEANDASTALKVLHQQHTENQKPHYEYNGDNPPLKLILIDMYMLDQDGIALGATIREDRNYDNIPLVLMTPISSKDDAQFYASQGFSAYFPKPTTTRDLFSILPLTLRNHQTLDLQLSGNMDSLAKPTGRHLTTAPQETPSELTKNPLEGARVLLVEDNIINQEVAISMLGGLGIRCDVTTNGLEALTSLRQREKIAPYQLILMDCQMPEMDGYETTRNIRQGKAGSLYREIPIIAMTANAMKGDKEKCLASGMNDYTSKPIDPSFLKNKMLQWLLDGKSEGEATSEDQHENESEQRLLDLLIWDKDAMWKRLNNKQDTIIKLITLFINDIPKSVKRLETAIEENDYLTIGVEAHGIKGVAANISGLRVRRLALQIELAGKAKDTNTVRTVFPLFKEHFSEFVSVIKQEL